MAKARGRQKRRPNRRRDPVGLPRGFALGVLLVVCAGLLAWYFRSALNTVLSPSPPGAAGASEHSAKKSSKPGRPSAGRPGGKQTSPAPEAADRFEFYDMLPDAEVEVTEQPTTTRIVAPPPISLPGTYVVQAGAFPDFAAADKVKARLALLGVASEIQVADSNGAQFHRVRIGPINDLDELNHLRARLRQNGIEHQVIPIGE